MIPHFPKTGSFQHLSFRYVGSVQIGGQPQPHVPVQQHQQQLGQPGQPGQPGHSIRDIARAAREGRVSSPEAPGSQPGGIPAAVLPLAAAPQQKIQQQQMPAQFDAYKYQQQQQQRIPPAVSPPVNIPSPPGHRIPVQRADDRQRQEAAALEKMKANAKNLPPPVDEVKLIKQHHLGKSQDQQFEFDQQQAYQQQAPHSPVSPQPHQESMSKKDKVLVQQRVQQLEAKRQEAIVKAKQQQLRQQQLESYSAAEREWMAQMKKSQSEDDPGFDEQPGGKSGLLLHQHGDEFDRYAFTKTGYTHQTGVGMGAKPRTLERGRTSRDEEGGPKDDEAEEDRFGDWVHENVHLPPYKEDDHMYRPGGRQYGYDQEEDEHFGNGAGELHIFDPNCQPILYWIDFRA